MKTLMQEISVATASSSECVHVAAAWNQFQKTRQADTRNAAEVLPLLSVPGYRLLKEIHRGGQGVVYLAIQESTRRKVAIKILKEGPLADSREFARFAREVDILSRINHPHIVAIHDRGLAAGHAYYTMDYIAGQSLDAYVVSAGLNVEEILQLFIKLCDAVNVAHLRGVIHRDLKPANIRIDEEGEPKVLDFGLAKVEPDSALKSSAAGMTVAGQFIGSLPWASPEQAEGRTDSIDIRTDVYSLGVILYHLLTGRFPYPVSGQLSDIIRGITQIPPVRLSTVAMHIDRDLELIVLKCLAKEPERRYQSAGDLGRDIQRYLGKQPIDARPSTVYYQIHQFVRRHKTLATSLASVFIILVAATTGTTWALLKATDSNHRANSINEFMREVLTRIDPTTGAADVKFSDVLARASASASVKFAGHPLQEAEVRDLLGQIYNNLSLWREAREEYLKALKLWHENAGPDDPRTLNTAMGHLATITNIGRVDEEAQLLADLRPRLERVFGSDDLRTLGARRIQANVQMSQGQLEEAERILLELRAHPRLAGPDGDELQIRIIHTLNNIGLRRADAAHPWRRADIFREIEPLAVERVERATRHYGADSPSTFLAKERLARILCGLGRHQEAADICRAILDQSASRLGACHIFRTEAMDTLSRALTGLDAIREAAELRLADVACTRQRCSPGDPVLIVEIFESLRYLERAGFPEKGEEFAREVIGVFPPSDGDHNRIGFEAEAYLGRFLSMQNRLDEAEEIFQALQLDEQNQQSYNRARLHLFYGYQLLRREKYSEAEQAFEEAVRHSGDVRNGTCKTHPDDIVLGYIALFEATGDQGRLVEYGRLRDESWALATGTMQPE